MITPDKIQRGKYWYFPKPKTDISTTYLQEEPISQEKFYCEYHPMGHAIFDHSWYKDIPIVSKMGTIDGYHMVNRIALPIQQMALEIIVPHLLGNHTELRDNTIGENKSSVLAWYREFWDEKNLDTARYKLVYDSMAVGDAAILFYKDGNTLKWKLLSFLQGKDEIYPRYDKYGELSEFARFYSLPDDNGKSILYCDIIDKTLYNTYVSGDKDWELLESTQHGFRTIPVVYHRRRDGAYHSSVQGNIDETEKSISRLSEDNRTKAKSRYNLKTKNPNNIQTVNMGLSDLIITETDGDLKLIPGADISTQFKYEYEMQMETIYNKLGIVFVKSKSSGDMPVGSMKLLFYPTERVCRNLKEEYNDTIDKINDIFKQGLMMEYPEKAFELKDFRVNASIKTFTPQDDQSYNSMIGQLKSYGVLSTQTASENTTISANDEFKRIKDETLEENSLRPTII